MMTRLIIEVMHKTCAVEKSKPEMNSSYVSPQLPVNI